VTDNHLIRHAKRAVLNVHRFKMERFEIRPFGACPISNIHRYKGGVIGPTDASA